MNPAAPPHEPLHWHAVSATQVADRLATDPAAGLSEAEAEARLHQHGENRLPLPPGKSALRRFSEQLAQPLVLVLIAAGTVTAFLGEWVDAGVIFGVVLVNAVIGYVQEGKAEAALAALAGSLAAEAMVLRGGVKRRLHAHALVPGDVVLLAAGDRVPADLRLCETHGLRAMEASLTGESTAVDKHSETLPHDTLLADRGNMAYAGTLVVSGQAAGLVAATGGATETGRISRLIAATPELQTPLTRKMAAFSNWLLLVIGGLALLTFAVGLLRGEAAFDMFMAAVALAVGAIPEGLPAAVTITLAIGVSRMAKRRAIIRRLPAVEALGSTTVICSDKTGTLTENAMTVRTLWVGGDRIPVSGSGYAPDGHLGEAAFPPAIDGALRELLLAGILCNDAGLARHEGHWQIAGDPTEGALLVVARKAGLDEATLQALFPRRDVLPFDAATQCMATAHEIEGQPVVYVKGAIERLLLLHDDAGCRWPRRAGGCGRHRTPCRGDGGTRRAGARLRPHRGGRHRECRGGALARGAGGRPRIHRPRRHDRPAAPARRDGDPRLPRRRHPRENDHRRPCRHRARHRPPARDRGRGGEGTQRP